MKMKPKLYNEILKVWFEYGILTIIPFYLLIREARK